MSIPWAFLAQIDSTQVCALGNSTEKGVNLMPWRYHRAKQQAQTLKILFQRPLRAMILEHRCIP